MSSSIKQAAWKKYYESNKEEISKRRKLRRDKVKKEKSPKFTTEQIEEIKKMRSENKTFKFIQDQTNLSYHIIKKILYIPSESLIP